MDVLVEEQCGVPSLALIGQFWEREDVRKVQDSLAEVVERNPKAIVANLERLTFIGSIGLGGLMKTFSQLKESGCELVLYRPSGNVREALELAEFPSVMKALDTEEELLSVVGEPSAGSSASQGS